MDWLKQVLGQAFAAFKDMTAAQRASMVVMGLTVAVALGMVIVLGARPKYVVLASGLDQTRLSDVARALDEAGEEYRTDLTRGAILVAQDRKPALKQRLLAEQVLSREEMFTYPDFISETSGIGVSNRHRNELLRIALQNELRKMIKGLEGIEEARVEIQPEKDSEFTRWGEESVGTTVMLTTRRGTRLDQNMANTIINMISSAVRYSDPEKITVVDAANWGQKFTRQDPKSVFVVGSTRWDLTKAVNDYYESKIQGFVEQTGYEAAVRVNCVLDLDGARRTLYSVDGEKTAVVSLEKQKKSTVGEMPPSGPTGLGVNGGDSLVAPAGTTPGSSSAGRPSEGKEDSQKLQQDYERMLTETVQTPGKIEDITVAVVLFDPAPQLDEKTGQVVPVATALTEGDLQAWPSLIAKAAGLGDKDMANIKVVHMTRPFREDLLARAGVEVPWTERMASYWPAARIAGLMLLATFALFFLYGVGKRAAINRPVMSAAQPSAAAETDKGIGLPSAESEDVQLHEVQRRLRAFVEQDPRKVAGLVKRWLVREG